MPQPVPRAAKPASNQGGETGETGEQPPSPPSPTDRRDGPGFLVHPKPIFGNGRAVKWTVGCRAVRAASKTIRMASAATPPTPEAAVRPVRPPLAPAATPPHDGGSTVGAVRCGAVRPDKA